MPVLFASQLQSLARPISGHVYRCSTLKVDCSETKLALLKKKKGKVVPVLNLTSILLVVGIESHVSAALPKEKVSLILIPKEAGCSSEPVWTMCKSEKFRKYRDSNTAPPPPTIVQPVTSLYTD
jgi:hypothetical protein